MRFFVICLTVIMCGNAYATTQYGASGGGALSVNAVEESHLKAVNTATDEYCLTYELTTGDFEWQVCGSGGVANPATANLDMGGYDITNIGGIEQAASATPKREYLLSTLLGSDKYAGSVEVTGTTLTDGAEVTDMTWYYMDAGTKTEAFRVDGSDNQFEFAIPVTFPAGNVLFHSMAIADLSDTVTPSVLTVNETTNKLITNYQTTGADHVFSFPTAHAAGNVIFMIGDEFQMDLEPPSGTPFYLNGTLMAVDEHIVNSADTLAEEIVCVTANLNGTLTWMCESKYTNFAEATP